MISSSVNLQKVLKDLIAIELMQIFLEKIIWKLKII